MDCGDHWGEEPKGVWHKLCLFVDTHLKNLLGEFNKQSDCFTDIEQLKELHLELHVEEYFAHDHFEREDEYLIILKLLNLEVKIARLLFKDKSEEI